MGNEIDRLEIAIEAEASKANRSLSSMEKHLDKVAEGLEKVLLLANGGISLDKMFKGVSSANTAEKLGQQMADSLIKGFNLNRAGADIKRQVKSLSTEISKSLYSSGPNNKTTHDIERLGGIVKKHGTIAQEVSSDYKNLYDSIKAVSKIKIRPETASAIGDNFKDRSGILRKKMSTKSGIELDSIYQELRGKYPHILPDYSNVEDQFSAINNAVREYLSLKDKAFRPATEDEAYEAVVDSVGDLNNKLKEAKTASDMVNSSMREMKSLSESFSFDTSGMNEMKKMIDSAMGGGKRKNTAPRLKRADLKYTATSLDDIFEKYKDVGTGMDLSGVGLPELEKRAQSAEGSIKRLNERLEKKISVEGTKQLGKTWESLIYDIQKVTNEADIYKNKINEIRSEPPPLRIHRNGSSNGSYSVQNEEPRTTYVSPESLGYDKSAVDEILSDTKKASAEINTFEAQIKRLKAELSDLAAQGYTQYDPEYDQTARELAEVTEAQKLYNKELREGAKESLGITKPKELEDTAKSMEKAAKEGSRLSRVLSDIKGAAKKINKAKSDVDSFRKALVNCKKAVSAMFHPLRTLTGLFSDSGKGANKGMSWGRMIGSSVLFSFVFQGISAIQRAIVEGSQNLVQYSQTYNRSISSMMTSLMYLKNAWTAAFAPIVNVVAPYISAFIDMLAGALNMVGQFMAALTGKGFAVQAKKVWKDYGASLKETGTGSDKAADGIGDVGDAAKKATKDLKSYTLGIDELNVIEPDLGNVSGGSASPSGGSGGAGGSGGGYVEPLPADMFETVEVESSIKSLVNMFKEAWKTADFTGIGSIVGDKLNSALESIKWGKIKKTAYKIGKSTATFLNGVFETPKLFKNIGVTIGEGLNTAIYGAKGFIDNFDWSEFGQSIADSINGFFETVEWDTLGTTISDGIIGILDSAEGLLNGTDWEEIADSIVELLANIKWGEIIAEGMGTLVAGGIAQTDFFAGIGKSVAQKIIEGITGKEMSDELEKKFNTAMKPIEDIWSYLFSSLNPVTNAAKVFTLVRDTIESGGENIKKFMSDCWKSIQTIFSPVGTWFSEKFKAAKDGVINAWRFVSSWFSENVASPVKSTIEKLKNSIVTALKNAYEGAVGAWDGISSKFKSIANSAIKPIGSLVNGIIDGVNWVSKKLGAGKVLNNWSVPRFARGSGGISRDTLGMVNDQSGGTYKELIVPPHGKPFIPEGRNVVLPLQRGTKIMPAGQTKEVMNGMPHFAGGIGDFFGNAWGAIKKFTGNVLDYVSKPKDLAKIALDKFIDTSGFVKPWSTIGVGIINKLFDAITKKIKGLLDKFSPKGVEKALEWAVDIAHDESHGYDQASRWGKPDYDCSSLVISAFEKAGIKMKSAGATYTGNLYNVAKKVGFGDVTKSVNLASAKGLKAGDILLSRGHHTAMYMGGKRLVHASINELGRATGGKPGDQTGKEICTRSYYNYPWTDVLRYSKAYRNGIGRFSIPEIIGTIPFLSDGGVMSRGQIFMARENGPELVGRQGNKSVVMNNNQIVRSVSAGVGQAVDGAIARLEARLQRLEEIEEAILDKDMTVNMDGKRVDKQLAKSRRNTGYNFSPNPA